MKAGYTNTQLAGKAFAYMQAYLSFIFYITTALALPLSTLAAGNPIVVPFVMAGNAIFIEANINGQSGVFLFDTGASDLILNSAYFEGETDHSEVIGLYGNPLKTQYYLAKNIEIGGTYISKDIALVLDLSNLEKAKNMCIAGIIGYSILKDFELHFDFTTQQILLFGLRKNEKSPAWVNADHSFDFKMSGHIPYLEIKLGGQMLRMGIDSGSERNILQPERLGLQSFEPTGVLRLTGLSSQTMHQVKGQVSGFCLGHLQVDKLEVILADLATVSSELPVRLDGVLGVQFLKNYKVAINFRLRKIYLWEPKPAPRNCQLAACEM
jgi:hypothetical protein